MNWTVETITEYCKQLAADYFDMDFNCPVKINGRLTKTLGRVTSQVKYWTKDGEAVYNATCLEISRQLLETSTDESIKSVIQHEFCHWVAVTKTGEPHGHDKYFKSICATIGCKNDGTRTKVERTVEAAAVYKHTVRCPHCDKEVGFYNRAGKVVKHPEWYLCPHCHEDDLEVIQNW